MPEGPEVNVLALKLQDECKNWIIEDIHIVAGRYMKTPIKGLETVKADLPLSLESITTKGKVLFFWFSKGHVLVSHLGLHGWWTTVDEGKRNRVAFLSSNQTLWFTDTINYGTLEWTTTEGATEMMKQMAPDPLSTESVSWTAFYQRVVTLSKAKQKWLMEDILMEQDVLVCGIGNYLKSEILYDACISPIREVCSLTENDWKSIFDAMQLLMTYYRDQLVQRNQAYGTYDGLCVYHKKTDPAGRVVEVRTSKKGRKTFWVPERQV